MKAYLVEVPLIVRILLPEHLKIEQYWEEGKGEGEIVAAAEPKLIDKIRTSLGDNISSVVLDIQVPYDPEHDGDQFCDTCDDHISHTTDGVRKRHCRATGEPLGSSMWQGCALHKPKKDKQNGIESELEKN